MVLVSSAASVRRGTPSLLAIVETIAASGFSFWLAWKYNSVQHIMVASVLAPFLLLRSRLSTWYTIRVANIIDQRTKSNDWLNSLELLLIPLIKILCSLKVFFRRPKQSLSSIPTNFYNYVFVIDLANSPEVVPGASDVKSENFRDLNAYDMFILSINFFSIESIKDSDVRYLLGLIAIPLFVLPLIVISFSFRFAIKSTALLWLPLLWIIHQAQPGANVLDRMKLNVSLASTKLMLAYSMFVVLGFVLKLGLLFAVWKLTKLSSLGPLQVLTTRLVAPYELPLWQVTSALNAGLAWAYFFRAQRYLLARDTTEAAPETRIEREYVAFQVVRTTFSLYAIACTLYIATATAWQARLPPIHFILFPRI